MAKKKPIPPAPLENGQGEQTKRGVGRPRKPIDPDNPPKPKRPTNGRPFVLETRPEILQKMKVLANPEQKTPEELMEWALSVPGIPIGIVCELVGIDRKSWHEWKFRAETDPDCPEFVKEFATYAMQVRARHVVQLHSLALEYASGKTKGAWFQGPMALLQRLEPDHYREAKDKPASQSAQVNVVVNPTDREADNVAIKTFDMEEQFKARQKAEQEAKLAEIVPPDEDDMDE